MSVSRRGFLASIVLAYAGARGEIGKALLKHRKKFSVALANEDQMYLYSQDLRVPFTDMEVNRVELERVRGAIPNLFERDDTFFRTLDSEQRVGGRRRRKGGRTRGVVRG